VHYHQAGCLGLCLLAVYRCHHFPLQERLWRSSGRLALHWWPPSHLSQSKECCSSTRTSSGPCAEAPDNRRNSTSEGKWKIKWGWWKLFPATGHITHYTLCTLSLSLSLCVCVCVCVCARTHVCARAHVRVMEVWGGGTRLMTDLPIPYLLLVTQTQCRCSLPEPLSHTAVSAPEQWATLDLCRSSERRQVPAGTLNREPSQAMLMWEPWWRQELTTSAQREARLSQTPKWEKLLVNFTYWSQQSTRLGSKEW